MKSGSLRVLSNLSRSKSRSDRISARWVWLVRWLSLILRRSKSKTRLIWQVAMAIMDAFRSATAMIHPVRVGRRASSQVRKMVSFRKHSSKGTWPSWWIVAKFPWVPKICQKRMKAVEVGLHCRMWMSWPRALPDKPIMTTTQTSTSTRGWESWKITCLRTSGRRPSKRLRGSSGRERSIRLILILRTRTSFSRKKTHPTWETSLMSHLYCCMVMVLWTKRTTSWTRTTWRMPRTSNRKMDLILIERGRIVN